MWNLKNKQKKQIYRHREQDSQLSEGMEVWGQVKELNVLSKQNKQKTLVDTDKNVVIT